MKVACSQIGRLMDDGEYLKAYLLMKAATVDDLREKIGSDPMTL
jgi:hypothetical protein